MAQSEAIIYLSENRGETRDRTYRSFHTFNFRGYREAHREPFMNLVMLNQDTLTAFNSISYLIPQGQGLLLIPIVGELKINRSDLKPEQIIEPGHYIFLTHEKELTVSITNPYDDEQISFISAMFSQVAVCDQEKISSLDIDRKQNSLVRLFDVPGVAAYAGKFNGRYDAIFALGADTKGVFAFVLEGAFEFENRLLQRGDGLSIANVNEVEFEALSDGAILLIFEMRIQNSL